MLQVKLLKLMNFWMEEIGASAFEGATELRQVFLGPDLFDPAVTGPNGFLSKWGNSGMTFSQYVICEQKTEINEYGKIPCGNQCDLEEW